MAETRWEGTDAPALAAALDLPRVELHARLGSTLDRAHELAADGAPAGTLVLAEAQTAGRGRAGRVWESPAGTGIWLALVERPSDPAAIQVLSIRAGLRAARVLDRFAGDTVGLKWPNDLQLGGRKLAGILIEARWRDGRADWVAIGFGINVRIPAGVADAAALATGTDRLDVLAELVPALRAAAAARGPLTPRELEEYASRDAARGRRCREPAVGEVRGITATGALLVARDAGARDGGNEVEDDQDATAFTTGSLRLESEAMSEETA